MSQIDGRPSWLAIREPLTSGKATILKLASFFGSAGALWCMVSYVPVHLAPVDQDHRSRRLPDVFVTGQRFTPEGFKQENDSLIAEHLHPGTGIRVNPIYLPAPPTR